MDRVVWRSKPQGGYTRVQRYENGRSVGEPISVNGSKFGDKLANELNEAYRLGLQHGTADGRREGRNKVADVLHERGMGDAENLVRQHPV